MPIYCLCTGYKSTSTPLSGLENCHMHPPLTVNSSSLGSKQCGSLISVYAVFVFNYFICNIYTNTYAYREIVAKNE